MLDLLIIVRVFTNNVYVNLDVIEMECVFCCVIVGYSVVMMNCMKTNEGC